MLTCGLISLGRSSARPGHAARATQVFEALVMKMLHVKSGPDGFEIQEASPSPATRARGRGGEGARSRGEVIL